MLKGPLLAALGKGGSVLATYLFYLIAARALGPTESGYFFLSFTLIMLLVTGSRAGLDVLLLKNTALSAAENGNSRKIFFKYTAVSFSLSSLFALICYLFAEPIAISLFAKPQLFATLQAMSPATIFLSCLWLAGKYFQGLRMIFTSELFATSSWSILLLITIMGMGIKTSIELSNALTLATGALLIFALRIIARSGSASSTTDKTTGDYQISLSSFGSLWLSTLFTQLLIWSSTLIAGALLAPDEVATLNVAQRAAMITAFSLVVANAFLAPRFATLYKQSNLKGLIRLSDRSIKYSGALSLIIFLLISMLPKQIMSLFGEGFTTSSGILIILAFSQLISVMCGSVQNILTMTGNEKAVLKTTAIVAAFSIVLCLYMTQSFGLWGSAVATAVSIIILNLTLTLQVWKKLGFFTFCFLKRDCH
ncbi:polysaccharide biosynthesis C-terminal domain-containing protein [Marinobacter pelagius]|uniref:oligosaccharide flippase family protein n=1 Tax=Marinobacter sp. C7 TaxID=2951363 RepID=UPI001EF0D04E|nr:polysaccharide biosynthesis C-terminal domain-containing protein [Marinobacter sp. C7]MCG7199105.1 polysaccharide biosynthesis C-terminal domain-containing protein [Marinobacter sp. C7]